MYTFFSFGGGPGAGVEVLGAGALDLEAGPPEKKENQDCFKIAKKKKIFVIPISTLIIEIRKAMSVF